MNTIPNLRSSNSNNATYFRYLLPDGSFQSLGKDRQLAELAALALVAFFGVTEYSFTTVELSILLGMSHQGGSKAAKLGRDFLRSAKSGKSIVNFP